MKDSVEFELSEPLKYSANGEEKEALFIEIRCPNLKDAKHANYHRQLKGSLGRALMAVSRDNEGKQEDDEGKEEIDVNAKMGGNQMTMLLYSYSDDFNAEVKRFQSHCHRYCFLDGETPLQDGPISRMDAEEFDKLFGTFCANFALPSLLKLLTGKNA